MATLMPSPIEAPTPKLLDSENLVTALRPWRKRLFMHQMLYWSLRGIITGLVVACLVLLAARIFPWATAVYWAFGLGIASPLLALGAAIWYRPSFARTASVIDKQLALHDRMSTAWELRESPKEVRQSSPKGSTTLVGLQRHDALKQLAKSTPTTAFPLHLKRSTVLTLICTTLALALLIFLPNPMTAILKQQADLQSHLARQIASIEKTRQQIDAQSAIPAKEKQQIDQVLRNLEAKLQTAKSETEAQQDLADAQAKLDQLRNPQAATRIQSQSTAGQSLQSSSDANLQAIGKALANNDPQSLAQALQNLASQASNLSQAQRDQLAQQLENAANQSSQNPALSSALHQLAQGLTDNSAKEMTNASHALQATANQTAAGKNSETTLDQASQSLQNAANNLAAPTDNPNTTSQGQQGQGQNQGKGQGQDQGQQGQNQGKGQGQEQGQQGQNQGKGQGQGQGQQGQNQGKGQGQGQGQGSSSGAGNGQGKNEQVYVPGQINQGSSTQSTGSNSNTVQSGNQVSYSQVIAQYNQMAHDAIDNSDISPDVKDAVHDYFNSLGGISR